MRFLATLVLVSSSVLVGQTRLVNSGFGRIVYPGGVGPGDGVSNIGPGRIVFPGTGAPAVIRPGTSPGPVFPILTGPVLPHQQHSNRVVVPVPVFYGGGGYYNYDPPPAQMVAMPVAAQQPYYPPQPYYPVQSARDEQPPVVIINQYFGDSVRPETQPSAAAPAPPQPSVVAATPPQQDDLKNIFMIAMKDHTIYAASAYWVEENTLNYITIQGSQNSTSLDLVDRELSQRLNRERKVSFGLPGK